MADSKHKPREHSGDGHPGHKDSESPLEHKRAVERDVERQREKLEHAIGKGERIIERRREKLEKDRTRVKSVRERESELERAIRELEEKAAENRAGELWTKRACLDGTTTWAGLKLVVVTIAAKTPWEGTLVAADRTSHADDCGDRSSQAELYYGWTHRLPGFNPANPPGTSSHEGINGGNGGSPVTTKVAVGGKLPPWMWGLDVGGAGAAFLAGARQLGFDVRQMPGESWHFNFMSDPTPVLRRLGVIG